LDSKNATAALTNLKTELLDIIACGETLDEKLADYVFFPLSHILRQLEKLPVSAVELLLHCVEVLLSTAWKSQIAPNLGMQLLILLSFLLDSPSKSSNKATPTEELHVVAFSCIAKIFQALSSSKEGREALVDTANVPQIGQTASIILDGLVDGTSSTVQLAAATTLQAFSEAFPDRNALAVSFLPGIVSALQKALVPSTRSRRSHKVLQACLKSLSWLLCTLVNDEIASGLKEKSSLQSNNNSSSKLDISWLTATASQVRIVLVHVCKLKHHDRVDVLQALTKLCSGVLEVSRHALSDSASTLLETLLALSSGNVECGAEGALKHLLITDPNFTELLRSSLHHWVMAFPRLAQSADDTARHRLFAQVSVAYRILAEYGTDLSMVDQVLGKSLMDSMTVIIHQSKKAAPIVAFQSSNTTTNLSVIAKQKPSLQFGPVLGIQRSLEKTVQELGMFTDQLTASATSKAITRDFVESSIGSDGENQIASFWLSLSMLRKSGEQDFAINDFLDIGANTSDSRTEMLDELYAFATSVLIRDDVPDWRLQAMSIEAVALQAEHQQLDFRLELVEVLYPIVHLIGSQNPDLRDHAITCLNIVAKACGYASTRDLLVGSVDYLVNAVALKLNTFDISPQAPQVLLMMVKLCGPSLLPYLDDLVDSMFAALESFHGYQNLVELLFSVLKVIAEEGAKTEQLALVSSEAGDREKHNIVKPKTIQQLAAQLAKRNSNEEQEIGVIEQESKSFANQPWKNKEKQKEQSAEALLDRFDADDPDLENESANATSFDEAEISPPAPKTYEMLLKISKLTQYYLTTSSPSLRTALLSLLDITFPALAKHENSFLPLINELWPVLTPRLDDSEAYVVANTLDVMATLCRYAGDFMRSRIEDIWSDLRKLFRQRAQMPHDRSKAPSGLAVAKTAYVDAPTRMIRESFFRLVTNIVEFVPLNEETFEGILGVGGWELEQLPDLCRALEACNPDAVWLAKRRIKSVGGDEATAKINLPLGPTTRQWKFATLE